MKTREHSCCIDCWDSGWNSALEEIRPKRCMCFVHKDIEGYKCEFCNLIEELKVKQ